MNTQTKFIRLIETLAKDNGFDLLDDSSGFVNVGVLRVQRPGSFKSLLSISYDFQGAGPTLKLAAGNGYAVPAVVLPGFDLDKAVAQIREAIQNAAKEKP